MALTDINKISINNALTSDKDNEFSIPLNISEIIDICKSFNNLGWQIQNQIDSILELGIEEAINSNVVKQASLPHIKHFLKQIHNNFLLGEASEQAADCLSLINQYEKKNNIKYVSKSN